MSHRLQLQPLGSTEIFVSPLGLGTVKFGRNQQVKYPTPFDLPDEGTVVALLNQAWEQGINILDTAPAYGIAEERLGQLLPHRHDWVIVGKVGEIFEGGESRFDFSADFTRRSVEASLRRLRRDQLDLVLVHSHGDDLTIIQQEEVCTTLLELKQRQLIRAVGISTKTVEGGLWCVEHLDVVMATFNPSYTEERPVLQRAAELGKGVIIKKGLQSGHADAAVGGGGVAESLRFVLQQPAVSSLIIGTINPHHLQANIDTAIQWQQSRPAAS